MKSCTDGFTEEQKDAIPEKIGYNLYDQLMRNEQKYFDSDFRICSNHDIDTKDVAHDGCLRKENHKGKHYCLVCGVSW